MLLGFLALDVEGITNSHPINLLTILNYVSFIIFIILSLCLSFTHTYKINQIKYKKRFCNTVRLVIDSAWSHCGHPLCKWRPPGEADELCANEGSFFCKGVPH